MVVIVVAAVAVIATPIDVTIPPVVFAVALVLVLAVVAAIIGVPMAVIVRDARVVASAFDGAVVSFVQQRPLKWRSRSGVQARVLLWRRGESAPQLCPLVVGGWRRWEG